MKQHVRAWGSEEYPDLDYETDAPVDMSALTSRYQFIQVALLTPITKAVIDAALKDL